MRLGLADGRMALLTYSGNVHPGERLDDVLAALDAAAAVRGELGLDRMAAGPWLSRAAVDQLAAAGGAERLADELGRRGLEVFTLNGFPYGNFHAPVVKRAVYHPDWTTEERRAYTLALAEILAHLLPRDVAEGTISTLPLAHRGEVDDAGEAGERARAQLVRVAADLARLADRTGRRIRVACEPEPGCLLETTADAIAWWQALPAAARRAGVGEDLVRDHLGLCFDTCHQAVAFEDAAASLDALAAAGVPVGKVQLSSALVIRAPGSPEGRAALDRFAEPRFLHQVRAQVPGGLAAADDLDQVDDAGLPRDRPWRVHFHVPIHRAAVGGVETTRGFLAEALAWLRAPGRALPHLEVETYTWTVLPAAERPRAQPTSGRQPASMLQGGAPEAAALAQGIAAELAWARQELGRP
jgi:sugar phosphate isomerase/epimerase